MKYSECYVKDLDQNLSIDDLENFCDSTNHLTKYSNSLFCPECKVAKLSYTGETYRTRSYLSAIDVYTHGECSYKYETINDNKEYVKAVQFFKPEKAQSMLNSAINILKPGGATLDDINNMVIELNEKKIKKSLSTTKKRYQANKRSFRYTIYEPNIMYLYYGKVFLKIIERNNKKSDKKLRFVQIYAKHKYIGDFLPYIGFDYEIIKNQTEYYLAFFGYAKGLSGKYINFYILDNSKKYLYIEECSNK